MKPSADRPLPGMARLVGEFLDRLTKRGDAATAWNQSSPGAASAATRPACSRAVFAGKDLMRRAAERLPASASPHPSSGRRATGLCRPNTAGAWPGFFRMHS